MSVAAPHGDAGASLDALWNPITIGSSVTLPHRVIQSAHEHNYGAPDFVLGEKSIRYWEDRARGGAALIITGAQTVHRSSFGHSARGAEGWRPEARDRYRRLAEAVHPHGTKVFVQLAHWGAEDVGNQDLWNFRELWGPSDVPSMGYGEHPRPMEAGDFAALVEGYLQTAANAQAAGCDGVEFHAAHGYLAMQFLSPLYNRREDEYGGSTENRCRFAIEVATAIREQCGPDFPLGIRLSFDEMHPTGAGIDPDEGERIVRVLSATGLYDYFNITGGAGYAIQNFIAPMSSGLREQFVPYAARVKKLVDVPVFMAGRVTDIRAAARLVAEGHVDVIAMTRAQIADAELVSKARSGRLDEIRECAGINQGCINRVFQGRELSCTQNPSVGREAEWGLGTLRTADSPKKVLVIGGGPAGLKAADVAASRGHDVVLYERDDRLGGQVALAAELPSRTEWSKVIDTLTRSLHRRGVRIELGVAFDTSTLAAEPADAIVLATGSRFATTGWSIARGERASIPGLQHTRVLSPAEVIHDPSAAGEDVVLVDESGGYIALGIAELLADRGCRVHVVTRHLFVGHNTVSTLDLPHVYPRLVAKKVLMRPQTHLERVEPDGRAELASVWGGPSEHVPVDSVVLVMGRQPNNDLYQPLSQTPDLELHRIGDCLAPRDVDLAFYDGERVGRLL